MATLTFLSKEFTNPFTESQFATFLAIADTLVPALSPAEIERIKEERLPRLCSSDWNKISPFLTTAASQHPDYALYLAYYFAHHVAPPDTKRIGSLLDTLDGGLYTYIFCGTTVRFRELSREQREQIMQGWKNAYLSVFKGLFDFLKAITMFVYLRTSPELFEALGYPRVDPRKLGAQELAARNLPKFTFETFGGAEEVEMETDVVIVGSGSGGQVVAAKLAGRGLKVLVLDKGCFFPQEELPKKEVEASSTMFENGGGTTTVDGLGTIVSASTWGGGSTVNFGVSLQLPRKVRMEWSEKFGLGFAETDAFQQCLNRVCERMGVSTENVRHNFANQVLVDGARKLGYNAVTLPRNAGGKEHYCGYCLHGCNSGEKHGGTITWLHDAQTAGARFVQSCAVQKVVIENGVARGVEAIVDGKTKLIIKAKKVVLSAGTIHTPCILQRSGVKNPNIGKNLKIHPVIGFTGTWDNTEIKPWEGGIMTALVTDFDNLDGKGYGAKIMAVTLHPGFAWGFMPWESAAAWRAHALSFPQSTTLIAIGRDRDSSGTVNWDATAAVPRLTYNLQPFDRQSMIESLIGCAELMVASGVDEIVPPVRGWRSYRVDKQTPQNGGGTADPRFKAYVAELRSIGLQSSYASAHPMGTCAMGAGPQNSVVDCKGAVWGVEALHIADASVLPSPTGVNPMITTMAMADWIAERILEDML
ncbi:hypothetical protein FN846DRAFT_931329 [Sphaerosporella brunnea]|uniref:Long-chain-alcohol oxidase n=1 Tax=Sphaerosporella brunnea TaxID=1250544 RepID=A0A5J5F867_9PEZI|nr:hypothetical protein FN846DRAFT_931329 [Sphaerosporella brunnea]